MNKLHLFLSDLIVFWEHGAFRNLALHASLSTPFEKSSDFSVGYQVCSTFSAKSTNSHSPLRYRSYHSYDTRKSQATFSTITYPSNWQLILYQIRNVRGKQIDRYMALSPVLDAAKKAWNAFYHNLSKPTFSFSHHHPWHNLPSRYCLFGCK